METYCSDDSTIDLTQNYKDDIEEVSDSSSEEEQDSGDFIIVGIDPGSVNCGFCEYNVTKGKAIKLERVPFRSQHLLDSNGRKASEDTDLGNAKIIRTITKYVEENKTHFDKRLIFIENQKGDNMEVLAVQYAFQTLFPHTCSPVAPHAIKSCYSDYFPKKPHTEGLSPPRRQEAQYRYDKKNAIKNGRRFVPSKVRIAYDIENPDGKEDGYDAYWITRFAADYLVDIESGELMKKPKKRKKNKDSINQRPRNKRRTIYDDDNNNNNNAIRSKETIRKKIKRG